MSGSEDNIFYRLAFEMAEMGPHTGKALQKALDERAEAHGRTTLQYRLWLISEFQEASEMIDHLSLTDARKAEQRKRIVSIRERLIDAFNPHSNHPFFAFFGGQQVVDTLAGLGDCVAAGGLSVPSRLDLGSLKIATDELLASVELSNLSEYPKGALILKLRALQRVLHDCSYYTDDDIRRRVKVIYADYFSEFRVHDKKHEALSEKVHRWARAAAGVGIFALALSSDVTTVAGLITKQ